MNPGTLNHRLQIHRQLDGLPMVTATGEVMTTASGQVMTTGSRADGYGQELDAWGLWVRAWARKIESAGREVLSNARESGVQRVVFRIRWRPDVQLTDRVVYNAQAYDIQSTVEVGRRLQLDLVCELRINNEGAV